MNLTLHIVKKDLRCLAVPLMLWSLLLLAQIFLGMRLRNGDGENLELLVRMGLYAQLFFALDLIVSYLMAASLIHDDPLVGNGVFWRTRPISGGRLFGAKLFGAALMFGVLPVLIWLPWWLACGYGAADIAAAIVETVFWKTSVVAPALFLAVLTDRFSRFLVSTMALLLVLMLALTLINAVVMSGIVSEPGVPFLYGVAVTRVWVVCAGVLFALLIAMRNQFFTRRTRRSLILAVTTLGVVAGVAVLWRWDWSMRWDERTPSSARDTRSLSFTLEQAERSRPLAVRNPRAWVYYTTTVRGIPDGLGLELGSSYNERTWQWPDGTKETVVGMAKSSFSEWSEWGAARSLGISWPQPDSKTHVAELARNQKFLEHQAIFSAADVSPAAAERMVAQPPTHLAKLPLLLRRPDLEFELPLRPSVREWHGNQSLRLVEAAVRKDERMFVNLVETQPAPLTAPVVLIVNAFDPRLLMSPFFPDPREYALVKRDRKEGTFISGGGTRQKVRIGTVQITWNWLAFTSPAEVDGVEVKPRPPAWFEAASLVRIGFVTVGRFTQEIKVDRFEMKP